MQSRKKETTETISTLLPNNIGKLNKLLQQHEHLRFNAMGGKNKLQLTISSIKYKHFYLMAVDANGCNAYKRLVAQLQKALPLLGNRNLRKICWQIILQDSFGK
jgi:hypothetical protein